jgi:hypothetical protein
VSYLLYCIFRDPVPPAFEIPDGVTGDRVFTANHNGLGAALSKFAEPDLPPDTSKLPDYETVVESFYRHTTVIPMRYACRVADPYDAIILLRENHDAYEELLHQLEGLAEVATQLLLDGSIVGAETDPPAILPERFPLRSSPSGAAYVDAKKPRYRGPQWGTKAQHALVENLCDSLHVSFVRHKVGFPSCRRSPLLSLYFLVPRHSVESFLRAARHLPGDPSVKLVFSGPRPPYNFVDALQK